MIVAAMLCVTAVALRAQRQFQVLATVTDPNGAEVASLAPGDVHVTENGVELTVAKVEAVNRVPKVQLLLDNGIGLGAENLSNLRTGVRGFLEALPPNIEVTLVTTAPQPRFLERATTDREKLLKAIDRLTADSGAGRFVESLYEATDRIDKDKDGNYTVVSLATSAGDANVRESDINKALQRVQSRHTTVHVILVTANNSRLGSGGVVQGEVGQAVAKVSQGRFENIAAASRIATLLPEIAAQMAKTMGGASRQFRFTVERPANAKGDLGNVQVGVTGKVISGGAIELADGK